MIDSIAMKATANPGWSVREALGTILKAATRLGATASVCAANFRWLQSTGRRHVVLLDYDVINEATANPWRRVPVSSPKGGPDANPYRFGRLASRLLIDRLQAFGLPPGAVAELLEGQRELQGTLSSETDAFLARLEHARRYFRPEGNKSSEAGALYQLLWEDTTRFLEDIADREFIDRLLARAKSLQALSEPHPRRVSPSVRRALDDAFHTLQQQRPSRDRNNFYDALNAATLAAILGEDTAQGPIPILVTQTRSLLDSGLATRPYFSSAGSPGLPFSVFTNPADLFVFESLLQLTAHRYGPAQDQALGLVADVKSLSDSCAELYSYCERMEKRGATIGSVSDLPPADWEMLIVSQRRLNRHWKSLLHPIGLAFKVDNAQIIRDTSNERTNAARHQALQRTSEQTSTDWLDGVRPTDAAILELATLAAERLPRLTAPTAQELNLEIVADTTFDVVLHQTTGRPLSQEWRPPHDTGLTEQLQAAHDVELDICPILGLPGAILRVTSSQRDTSASRRLSFVWLHSLDPQTAVRQCLSLASSVCSEGPDFLEYELYGVETVKNFGTESALVDFLGSQPNTSFDFLGITGRTSQAFVDLAPLEGVELQLAVTLDASEVTSSMLQMIAHAMSESSLIPGMPEALFRRQLDRAMQLLRVSVPVDATNSDSPKVM